MLAIDTELCEHAEHFTSNFVYLIAHIRYIKILAYL